jgi:hypothetical protein
MEGLERIATANATSREHAASRKDDSSNQGQRDGTELPRLYERPDAGPWRRELPLDLQSKHWKKNQQCDVDGVFAVDSRDWIGEEEGASQANWKAKVCDGEAP